MIALIGGLSWLIWVWFSGQMETMGYMQEAGAG